MKEKRPFLWRWCPQPERIRTSRNRIGDRSWMPLLASTLMLSLLAVQGIQMWGPSSAVNAIYPNNYGPFPTVETSPEIPAAAATTIPSQTTTTVPSDHFTVQFTFPEFADPGNTITISAATTARASVKVNTLSIQVFAYVNKQLASEGSATILKDKRVHASDTWQTTLVVTIPSNAERSEMIGTVTEMWEETTSYDYSPYYYSSPYYNYYPYGPYEPYNQYDPNYRPYPYDNYNVYYVYQPSYLTVQKSSQQTVPLTYVLATTPEYQALLAKDKQLQQEYDALVAKHNELSSQYDSLRKDYDQAVSQYNQLQSTYNTTTLELDNYKISTYALVLVSAALAAAVLFLVFRGRRASQQQPKK